MNESKLGDLLERLGGLLRAEQRAAGIAEQLQPVHQDVLHYLSRCNRYSNTPAAVTEYLQITKGTASQSIQVLQRRGLILKQADKEDGRIVRLRLSARGHRLIDRLSRVVSSEQLCHGISAAELAGTENSLTMILRELQQCNDYRSFGQCHTCHHFRQQGSSNFRCGLTGEPLIAEETHQICREHKVADAMIK